MNHHKISKTRIFPVNTQILTLFLVTLVIISTIRIIEAKPQKTSENILDGVISQDEYSYSQSTEDGKFILYWEPTDENTIFFAMQALTTGYMSIGINPSQRMKDADMYFGWVDSNGSVFMIDAFAVDDMGTHPPDTELGGTNDILDYNGSENAQTTIIEFKRLIVSPDSEYDNAIPMVGEIPIIWAYGTSDNFEVHHGVVSRGTMFWSLEGASVLRFDFSQPFILGLAFLITLTGLVIYVDSKGRPTSNNEKTNSGE